MKRIIAIVVTLALILTSIAVPVLAVDEYTTPGPAVFNLLDRYAYYGYSNDYIDVEEITRSFRFNGFTYEDPSAYYVFYLVPNLNMDSEYGVDISYLDVGSLSFTFISSVEVGEVYINFYDLNDDFYQLEGDKETEYTIPGSNEILYLYTYRFDIFDLIANNISFEFSTQDYYDAYFEAISLYRYSYEKRIMPIMSLDAYGTMLNSEDDSYYQQRYFYDHAFVPGDNINIAGDSGVIMPEDDRLSVFIDFDSGFVGADKFTMSMVTTGVWDNYYDYGSASEAGILVKTGDGDTFNIPVNTYFTKAEGLSWQGLPVYYVSFVADLNSYDLNDVELTLNFVVNGRYPSRQGSIHVDYYFRVESVYFYFGQDEYRSEEDRFFNRLDQWFQRAAGSRIVDIQSLLYSLYDMISNQFTNVRSLIGTLISHVDSFFDSLFSQIETKFEVLFEQLDLYFGVPDDPSPPDNTGQEQDVNDQMNEMGSIAEDFAEAGNEIEELLPSTPSYDDTGLPEFADIASARILELRAVFVVIWENDFVIQLLTFSCLLALGGFILFGER